MSLSEAEAERLACTHYDGLRRFLTSYLSSRQATANTSQQRINAREKLTKLSRIQFADMSTDVFDEMNRRQKDANSMPFLPVREDFHPKRNQARQKLATLALARFQDLTSDVYYEVERRFPIALEMYLKKHGAHDGTLPAGTPKSFDIESSYRHHQEPSRKFEAPPRPRRSPSPPFDPLRINNSPPKNNSLDNLIAGLGQVLSKPQDTFESSISQRERDELEAQLKSMTLKYEDEKNENQKLRRKLDEQSKDFRDLEAALSRMNIDYKKLQADYDTLMEDYRHQQKISEDIKKEASNLMSEMNLLKNKNEEITGQMQQLEKQNNLNRGYPVDSAYRSEYGGSENRGSHPPMDASRLSSIQGCVEDLIRCAQNDTPTNALLAVKSVVIACRNLTEDMEHFQSSHDHQLSHAEKEDLEYLKSELTGTLRNLINASKSLGAEDGSLSLAVFENIARNLVTVSQNLISGVNTISDKMNANAAPRKGSGASQMDRRPYYQSSTTQEYAYHRNTRDTQDSYPSQHEEMALSSLKTYLEKQTDLVVQSIQNLLFQMRKSNDLGHDFDDVVSEITSIVHNLVSATRPVLQQPTAHAIRDQGEIILRDLDYSNQMLESLGASLLKSSLDNSKPLKQKIASSSYEIAKHVKALINLLE